MALDICNDGKSWRHWYGDRVADWKHVRVCNSSETECAAMDKQRDGTIPLSEALAAVARAEPVEYESSECDTGWHKLVILEGNWFKVSAKCLDVLTRARFRLAPPSRLKALVERKTKGTNLATDYLRQCYEEAARDIVAYLREQPACQEGCLHADDIERTYLGGGK